MESNTGPVTSQAPVANIVTEKSANYRMANMPPCCLLCANRVYEWGTHPQHVCIILQRSTLYERVCDAFTPNKFNGQFCICECGSVPSKRDNNWRWNNGFHEHYHMDGKGFVKARIISDPKGVA